MMFGIVKVRVEIVKGADEVGDSGGCGRITLMISKTCHIFVSISVCYINMR